MKWIAVAAAWVCAAWLTTAGDHGDAPMLFFVSGCLVAVFA